MKWIIWKLTFLRKLLENILCSIIYGKVCHFSLVGLVHFTVIVQKSYIPFQKKVLLFLVICTWNLLSYSNHHNIYIFEIYKAYPIFFLSKMSILGVRFYFIYLLHLS